VRAKNPAKGRLQHVVHHARSRIDESAILGAVLVESTSDMTTQDLLSYLAEVGEADAIEAAEALGVPYATGAMASSQSDTLRTPRDHDLRLRNASTGRDVLAGSNVFRHHYYGVR
jgi:hypothetical protein